MDRSTAEGEVDADHTFRTATSPFDPPWAGETRHNRGTVGRQPTGAATRAPRSAVRTPEPVRGLDARV